MAQQPDVLILGGGVIGLTTAYFLAREGIRVTVVDQGDFGREASWAGAGILPPADVKHARTPFDQLRAHGLAMFPSLSNDLRELTGIDNGYVRSGGLEFLGVAGEIGAEEWHGEGITCQTLDEPAWKNLEPKLASGLGQANFLPDMAQLRNPRHVKALLAACRGCGVETIPGCSVHSFTHHGGRVTGVKTLAGLLGAGKFLVATGAWTDHLMADLGIRLGIHPVRGQIALLDTGSPIFHRILLWGAHYLVPRPDGRVLVGSTEEKAGFDKRTTADAIGDLLTLANRLVPSLAGAHLERCWAGLRPGSPDGLPYLGKVPGFDNLFIAAGHFRAGIQLSPGTAQVMKECILGKSTSVGLEPFRVDRN